jgi:hypothetical protein
MQLHIGQEGGEGERYVVHIGQEGGEGERYAVTYRTRRRTHMKCSRECEYDM